MSSSTTSLPPWPPTLTQEQQSHLLLLATSYALGHGYNLLPTNPTTPPTAAIPAPLSLFPTPFPRDLYELAVSLQPLYNRLYSEIARDVEFLDRVMGGSVSKVDEFQGELWRCWKECREELVQVSRVGRPWRSQDLMFDTLLVLLLAAVAVGSLPLRLPSSRFRNWRATGAQTSRIQHDLVKLRSSESASRQPAQASTRHASASR
jgi:hypothetical protein